MSESKARLATRVKELEIENQQLKTLIVRLADEATDADVDGAWPFKQDAPSWFWGPS